MKEAPPCGSCLFAGDHGELFIKKMIQIAGVQVLPGGVVFVTQSRLEEIKANEDGIVAKIRAGEEV